MRDEKGRFIKGFKHTQEAKEKIKENNAKYWLGKTHSPETRLQLHNTHIGIKISSGALEKRKLLVEDKSNRWKGNEVGYHGIHRWAHKNLIRPQTCRDCNEMKQLELSNISREYKREISDWEWLCVSCHRLKDARSVQQEGKITAKEFFLQKGRIY